METITFYFILIEYFTHAIVIQCHSFRDIFVTKFLAHTDRRCLKTIKLYLRRPKTCKYTKNWKWKIFIKTIISIIYVERINKNNKPDLNQVKPASH